MTCYYNSNHVPKQFKVEDFIKLSTKYLRFKHCKLSSHWVGLFRVLEQIGGQAYHLTLLIKYSWLHNVFPVQLLESYHHHENNDSLMAMPDLEDPQDKWEVEEVLNRRQIKNVIHYLVKWVGWPSEYNLYKPVFYLVNALQAVAAFEQKLKQKQKSV